MTGGLVQRLALAQRGERDPDEDETSSGQLGRRASACDFVPTVELANELAAARARAGGVAAQLDQATAQSGDRREHLRTLDAEFAKLEGPDAERAKAVAGEQEPVRLLDELAADDFKRLLDQPDRGSGEIGSQLCGAAHQDRWPSVRRRANGPIDWGGEIQDPTLRREAALRAVVEGYDRWDDKRYYGRYGTPDELPIGETLAEALHELREAVA